MCARGQSVIKSAYKPDYRRPNQARKAAGIQQKVAGKAKHQGKGAGKPKHQDKQQVSSPEKVKKEAW